MRLRNENLKTGKALAWVDKNRQAKTRVVLFLVQGAGDISALNAIDRVCDNWIKQQGYQGFSWHSVADPGQISLVDPRLFSADIRRFEACEFRDLSEDQIEILLNPLIDRICAGESELLPRAGAAVGAPAEGVQFLNRTAETNSLASMIRQGESFFIRAPRRTGKTSLMRRLQELLLSEFSVLSLNLERDPTPAEAAARVRSTLTGEGFQVALRSARQDSAAVLSGALNSICEGSEKPLVLFIDELVSLFNGIKSADPDEGLRRAATLSFLKALADPIAAHEARVVIAGSVDWLQYLESELSARQSDLPGIFSRLQPIPLKPLDLEHPECELRRLLMGSELVPEAGDVNWLAEHIDLALPFPAVKFLDQVLADVKNRSRITTQELQSIFDLFLAQTESFADFNEHLNRHCPTGSMAADVVAGVLSEIASHPFEVGIENERVKTIFARTDQKDVVYQWLYDTFPITSKDGRTRFMSHLFQHWWNSQMRAEVR
jgi:hypothetical protein